MDEANFLQKAGLSPSSDRGMDVKILNQFGSVMIEPSRMQERWIIRNWRAELRGESTHAI